MAGDGEAVRRAEQRVSDAWAALRRAQVANDAAEIEYDEAKREVESLRSASVGAAKDEGGDHG